MDSVNENSDIDNARMRQRGGSKYSALRIVQLVVALVVLVGASTFFIRAALYDVQSGWILGYMLLIIGCILPFIEIPE